MMSGSGYSAVGSGVGTNTPDINTNTDAGSASSSPFRSVGTQRLTPALKSLFYMAFVMTGSWERDLRYRSRPITVERGTDPMMLMFLPAANTNTITASELEAAQSIGRDLRFIADDYAETEEVRRRTMELERRESFLERLLLCW